MQSRSEAHPSRTGALPRAKRTRTVQALPPAVVERIRRYLLERRRMRDTTLVSVLAYAGLRPGEALALTWAHVRGHTILVERAACSVRSRRPRPARPAPSDSSSRSRGTSPSGDSRAADRTTA